MFAMVGVFPRKYYRWLVATLELREERQQRQPGTCGGLFSSPLYGPSAPLKMDVIRLDHQLFRCFLTSWIFEVQCWCSFQEVSPKRGFNHCQQLYFLIIGFKRLAQFAQHLF